MPASTPRPPIIRLQPDHCIIPTSLLLHLIHTLTDASNSIYSDSPPGGVRTGTKQSEDPEGALDEEDIPLPTPAGDPFMHYGYDGTLVPLTETDIANLLSSEQPNGEVSESKEEGEEGAEDGGDGEEDTGGLASPDGA